MREVLVSLATDGLPKLMIDVLELYNEQAACGRGLAILPTRKLEIECPFKLESVVFVSPDHIGGLEIILREIDDRAFLPIQAIDEDISVSEASGDTHRRYASKLSGISKEALTESVVALVPISKSVGSIADSSRNHMNDLDLLSALSFQAFRALDLVRFQFCNLVLPDRLPGIPGQFDDGGFLCAAILTADGRGRLIGGRKPGTELIQGLGIDLSTSQITGIPYCECAKVVMADDNGGEIGTAVRKALNMYSRAMHANSDTLKFLSTLSLLEFIGTGPRYTKFEEVRKMIQPHLAKNSAEYSRHTRRFRELTSLEDQGHNIGLRHRIVHEGAFLEELLPEKEARKEIFQELDKYAGKTIVDMANRAHFTWEDLRSWRMKRTDEINRTP